MKKLNAKRTLASVTYEFLDGTEKKLTVQSLSTAEFEEVGKVRIDANGGGNEANKKAIALLLVKNEPEIIEKVLKEQFDEGSYNEFATQLFEIIGEEKKGKPIA